MNMTLTAIGLFLMVLCGIFTFVTFGFGIICAWPLLFIGIILFILGVVANSENKMRSYRGSVPPPTSDHYELEKICPNCGCVMQYNASTCPCCGKKFWLNFITRK